MANFQLQLFLSWNDDVTLSEVTKPRYGSVYPWPLNVILSWKKRSQVKKKLTALGWGNKTLEEVRDLFNIYRDNGKCCFSTFSASTNEIYYSQRFLSL